MFKKIKHLMLLLMVSMMVFSGFGCQSFKNMFTKTYKTESGKTLSASFGNIYQFNSLAKDLYDTGLKLANEGYEKGYLDDSDVELIIEKATIYKDLQNLGSDAIIAWYESIENNENNSDQKREIALSILSKVVENGKEFADLIEELSDGKIHIPEGTIPIMTTLFGLVKNVI